MNARRKNNTLADTLIYTGNQNPSRARPLLGAINKILRSSKMHHFKKDLDNVFD